MIEVRFLTTQGKLATAGKVRCGSWPEAKAAVQKYAAEQGMSNVREHEDPDDDDIRFSATTPGGRAGRNIAFAGDCFDEAAS